MSAVIRRWPVSAVLAMVPLGVWGQGLTTSNIESALGRSGQKTGEVYRVGFPRTDLHVTVNGISLKAGFALGSWAAFSGSDSEASVMGDLVLLEGEVAPVMAKLRESGFEITGVHNHLLNESPRVIYMHYLGHGRADDLAKSLRGALAVSKTPLASPPAAATQTNEAPAFVKTINDTLGSQGKWSGGVLSFGIPRSDTITEAGMSLSPPQGVAQSINFQEAGTGKVAATGDFVLIASEVNPVITALQQNHIAVTALHSHMLVEEPRLFFMHFWGVDSPQNLAASIKAALTHIAVKQ
ncbi:MAG TPA: DUF1259 domain-containing protein [Candidatus Acidoferrales bacterium]|nr:DUF1259 domain-containing protein [Candidatus Acidoferrales bacterium]